MAALRSVVPPCKLLARSSIATQSCIRPSLDSSSSSILHAPDSHRVSSTSSSTSSALASAPGSGSSSLRLVFLGGPGVGKGTYARMLSLQLGIPHISTGDLVRAELSSSSSSSSSKKLQENVREVVNQGKLLPDDIVLELLSNRLRTLQQQQEQQKGADSSSTAPGFILDGFPRTLQQARILDEALHSSRRPVDMALNLQLEEEALVAKCLGRRVCTHCGKDYNLAHLHTLVGPRRLFLPARLPHPTSACASALSVRADDASETVVRERLRVHARESASVEEHYRSQGKLLDLDVGPGMEHVWPRLLHSVLTQASVLHNSSSNSAMSNHHPSHSFHRYNNRVNPLPQMMRC